MMEFLHGRYGTEFMSDLHRDDADGLISLQGLLDRYDPGTDALDVVHEWAAMVALDGPLDDNSGRLHQGDATDYQTPTLDAAINWDTADAYSEPGAPPNGSDYVRLRDSSGSYLNANNVRSLTFDGAAELPTRALEWTVDPDAGPGGAALYSGSGANLDRAAVTEVTVPADDPTLTFETRYQIEQGWDFGFVQVSTDGGETYQSQAGTTTTTETDPGAIAAVKDNVPGYTGDSGGWITETVDLSAYAGQTVLLSFRYVTDPAVDEPGWWVDDITVGDTPVSDGSSTEGFRSASEVNPADVQGWTVQLVGYSSSARQAVRLAQVPLDGGFDTALSNPDLRRALGGSPQLDVVAAIVTHDDPSETVSDYAGYQLTANGTIQPGGG